jgi:hypothetical protein
MFCVAWVGKDETVNSKNTILRRVADGLTTPQELHERGNHVVKGSLILMIVLFASVAWTQDQPKKYPWQNGDTSCDKTMSFCWYGSEIVSDPQVTAYGNRWVSQDKEEKPFEWVTQVRCIQEGTK